MYVCVCNGITDKAIRNAIGDGVRTYRELSFSTGCGTQCGSCTTLARSILREELGRVEARRAPAELHVVSAA